MIEKIRSKMIKSCDYAIHEVELTGITTQRMIKKKEQVINRLKNARVRMQNMSNEEIYKFSRILELEELEAINYIKKQIKYW